MQISLVKRSIIAGIFLVILSALGAVGFIGNEVYASEFASSGTLKEGDNSFTVPVGDYYYDFVPDETAIYQFNEQNGNLNVHLIYENGEEGYSETIFIKGVKYQILLSNDNEDPLSVNLKVEKKEISNNITDFEITTSDGYHNMSSLKVKDLFTYLTFTYDSTPYNVLPADYEKVVDVFYTEAITTDISVDNVDKLRTFSWKSGIPKDYDGILKLKGKGDITGEVYIYIDIFSKWNFDRNTEITVDSIEYDGKNYEANKHVKVIYYDQDSNKDITLKNGKDFKIVGYVRDYNYVEEGKIKWISGVPKEPGYYWLRIEGIAPYYGFAEYPLYIVDKADVRSYNFATSSIYNGKPLGAKKVNGHAEYSDKNNKLINLTVDMDKDFKITGYCPKKTFISNIGKENSIKWTSGYPTNVGSYYIKIEGIGSYKGVTYANLNIEKDFCSGPDLQSSSIIKLNAQSVDFTTSNDGYIFYKIRPSKSGMYKIYTKGNPIDEGGVIVQENIDTFGALFDSDGVMICFNDDGDVELADQNGYGVNCFLIKEELKVGKTYYLGIRSYAAENTPLGILTGKLYIEGPDGKYVYYEGPEIKEENKPDDKPDDNSAKPLSKGKSFSASGYKFKVSASDSKKKKYEVVILKNSKKKAKSVTINPTVKYNGVTYKVTGIAANAFKNNKKLTKVVIGKYVKTIGKNAFSGCTKLKKVTFKGTALTKIENTAFKKCTSLKSFVITKKVKSIGKGAFNGCKNLSKITIKSTKLKTVGSKAFKTVKKGAKFKCPKKKKKAYTKLLKKSGLPKKAKITK